MLFRRNQAYSNRGTVEVVDNYLTNEIYYIIRITGNYAA